MPEAADLKVEESAELKGEVAEEIEDANGIEVEELELERDIYEATPLDDSPEGAEAAFEKEEEAVDDAGDDFHDALAAVEEIEVEEDEVEVEGYESEAEADEEYVAAEIGEEAEDEVVVPDVAGKLERTLGSLWLLMLVVLAGVVLRILWYWKQPALWLDEANVTSEVLGRSFGQLIEPLGEDQSAPIGFLLAVKSSIAVIGDSEIGLRAIPLLTTLLALALMAWTARRFLDSSAALIAVGMLSVSWPVIRYAGELKQYSTAVLVPALMPGIGAVMLA